MEEVRKTPSPQPERPKSSLEVVLEAMTSLQSNMHSLHSTTRELVSRLEKLESPQSHKFVVDASSNPGSATGLVDTPDHSTVGLEERGLERTKEYFDEVPMASLRRSERLALKAAVAYNEIESESRWQLKTLVDSNLPYTLSHVDFPSQMHPRRHADPYVHETRDGVTVHVCMYVCMYLSIYVCIEQLRFGSGIQGWRFICTGLRVQRVKKARSRGQRARKNLSTGFYRETILQERTS